MSLDEPVSVAALELRSVPAGLAVLDGLVKEAEVRVRFAGDVDPGHWLIVFDGPLADVEVALDRAVAVGADDLLETLLLPAAHRALRDGLRGAFAPRAGVSEREDSLGALECHTILATLAATDSALKAADVVLLRLRVATHLAGTGHAVIAGAHEDVEASLAAAVASAQPGVRITTRLIARAAAETVVAAGQRGESEQRLRPLDP